jgi:hypothetical protein
MSEIDDENRIEKQFISSHAFHRTTDGRVRKTTTEKQFKTRILESFDPVTLEHNRASPTAIQSQQQHKQRKTNSLEHRPGHEQATKTGRQPCTRAED